MEETKLDKFVGKIFLFVERKTGFLQNINLKPKTLIILGFVQLFCGISLFLLRISFPNRNDPFIINIFNYLQGPASVLMAFSFFHKAAKKISDIDLKVLQFSRKLYSDETVKFCFEPIIADWKNEYAEAISQKNYWQARTISIRYIWAFISAIFQQTSIGKLLNFLRK